MSSLHSEAVALLLIFATVSVTALNRMRQRIQFPEKTQYSRIVARVPADLEHACRCLANNEGWGLGDLCRSLIVLGACGSYLTLRSLIEELEKQMKEYEEAEADTN